jgi:hypothetical protein
VKENLVRCCFGLKSSEIVRLKSRQAFVDENEKTVKNIGHPSIWISRMAQQSYWMIFIIILVSSILFFANLLQIKLHFCYSDFIMYNIVDCCRQ